MANLPQRDKFSKSVILENSDKPTQETLEEYLMKNPHAGVLKVVAFTAKGFIPISEARVYITKLIGEDRVMMEKGLTDESGILDNIVLPAPSRNTSFLQNEAELPYAVYDIKVEHADYESVLKSDVPIYEGIKSIQNINMMRKGTYNGYDT